MVLQVRENNNMRIFFTGAQGTGKTTLMSSIPDTYNKIQNITRSTIVNNGLAYNKDGNDESQKAIFSAYLEEFNKHEKEFCISERSLIDVLAYTLFQGSIGKCSGETIRYQENVIKEYVQNHCTDLYIYFPIEFDVVDDGTRSTDEKYRKAIDYYIKDELKRLDVDYTTITGTQEERKQQFEQILKDLEIWKK